MEQNKQKNPLSVISKVTLNSPPICSAILHQSDKKEPDKEGHYAEVFLNSLRLFGNSL